MKKINILFFILITNLTFGQTVKTEITNEEKIFGLSKIWSEVKYNFANFDISGIDWDETYKTYIAKVLATKTTEEYYKELIKLMASLKDGHSKVSFEFPNIDKPPLTTKLIENKIIVTKIYNDILRKNINIGDEILEINRINAIEYGKINIMPFQHSSTNQHLNLRTYSQSLLKGDRNEKLELKLKKKDNSIFSVSVDRNLKSDRIYKTYEFQITNDNIAYLKVNDFANNEHKKIFDSLYAKILPTKALIIDIRENDGGSGNQGFYILSHLIEKNTLSSKSKTRQNISAFKAWEYSDMWLEFAPDIIKPIENKEKFLKPVIVLTSVQTFSAGEDFLVAFDNSKRGIKIGQATGGSTGQPLMFDLPKGGSFRICTKRDVYPNGKEFIGIGIIPDIEVLETVKSIQDKKDIVLEKAIEILNKKK